ncbi:MAG: hypothetical protein Fur0037_14230 [Planctomycetota bacterium]
MPRRLLPLLCAACAAAPLPEDPEKILREAESLLADGRASAAADLLERVGEEPFGRALGDRYEFALGSALFAADRPYDAFLAIRDFADDHPASDLRARVASLEHEIGRSLVKRGGGFLFFWSDLRAGKECLEHLVTRYPDSEQMADSLRMLGDIEFDAGNHAMAQERYRDLLRRFPESEWAPYARYRYAMSLVATLRGPDYDLDAMEHASKELADFLADPPEHPEFAARAREALDRVTGWRAERYWSIAQFYKRIGNTYGYEHHLRKAASEEFAGTRSGQRARRELDSIRASSAGAGG